MDMTLRWFGEGVDSVSLEQIRQIPGVKGIITTLYDIPAGEAWPMERILQMKEYVESKGLKVMGIESVNIHDAIKVGIPEREQYIANYITTLERLGQAGNLGDHNRQIRVPGFLLRRDHPEMEGNPVDHDAVPLQALLARPARDDPQILPQYPMEIACKKTSNGPEADQRYGFNLSHIDTSLFQFAFSSV